jgi:hypothetical protein
MTVIETGYRLGNWHEAPQIGVPSISSAEKSASSVQDQVYQQLLKNYPPDSIQWVKDADWTGPANIPQDRIDQDAKKTWAAYHEPARVDHFEQKIRNGEPVHPAVGVLEPGPDEKIKIIDGHHRDLAYARLGLPVKMYVGRVSRSSGPWNETHSFQFHQGASSANKQHADLVKVGPEGYIHGFICVRPPCGKTPSQLQVKDLSAHSDGSIVHEPSGYQVGHIERSGDSWQVRHSDGSNSAHDSKASGLKALAHRFNTAGSGKPESDQPKLLRVSESDTLTSVAHQYALRGKQVLPGILGGGQSSWNGQIQIFRAAEKPSLAAQMDWDGNMEVQDGIARSMKDMLSHPDAEISSPDPFAVVLHELIHSIVPEDQIYAQNSMSFQDFDTSRIEEGFTELGTIQHAPEFFDKIGVGNLPTPVLATDSSGHVIDNPEYDTAKASIVSRLNSKAESVGDDEAAAHISNAIDWLQDDDPQSALDELDKISAEYDDYLYENRQAIYDLDNITSGRHATLSEYVKRLQSPEQIKNGAWGHYADETARAYSWMTLVAQKMTGKDEDDPETQAAIVDLSDEVNREGPAGKIGTMASQVALAELGTDASPDTLYQAALAAEQIIKFTWGKNDPVSTLQQASNGVRRVAQKT